MLLARTSRTRVTPGTAAAAGLSLWRGLAAKAEGEALHNSGDRPLSADPAVRKARRQQSLSEPALLHDSLSGADYGYAQRRAGVAIRMSSLSEPDYYLHNSLSEGQYHMPAVLRSAALKTKPTQGFSSAKQRPTMQRIVVINRSAAQEPAAPLHDSFSHGDYNSPYKNGR